MSYGERDVVTPYRVSKIQPTQIEMANIPHAAPRKYLARDSVVETGGVGLEPGAGVGAEDMGCIKLADAVMR